MQLASWTHISLLLLVDSLNKNHERPVVLRFVSGRPKLFEQVDGVPLLLLYQRPFSLFDRLLNRLDSIKNFIVVDFLYRKYWHWVFIIIPWVLADYRTQHELGLRSFLTVWLAQLIASWSLPSSFGSIKHLESFSTATGILRSIQHLSNIDAL